MLSKAIYKKFRWKKAEMIFVSCPRLFADGYSGPAKHSKELRHLREKLWADGYHSFMVTKRVRIVEEVMNSVMSGIGFLLSIAVLVVLVVWAVASSNVWAVIAVSIYGSTLIFLYLTSVLCHSLSATRAAKVMEIIDCSAVYVLIAGTYTPFAFLALRGGFGWGLFTAVWLLAVVGILVTVFSLKKGSLLLYLIMGWLIVVAIVPLLHTMPSSGVVWLFAGGIAYSGGVLFFVSRRPFSHLLWHSTVLLGSICHFFAILTILPH